MSTDALRAPKSKIKRAKSHLADLDATLHELMAERKFYKVVIEHDDKRRQEIHKAFSDLEIGDEPEQIVFDIFQNLNSALDQIACAVAAASGKDMHNVYFIVGAGPDVFESRRFETTIKKLPQAAVDLMRALKPYKGGNDLLYGIHALAGKIRHRILTPIAMVSTPTDYYVRHLRFRSTDPQAAGLVIPSQKWRSLDDGIVLFKVGYGAQLDVQVQVTGSVGFGDVEVFKGEPVCAVANQAIDLVERVLAAFEDQFFR